MSRKIRMQNVGFYHIVNRGVAKTSIYHDDEDFSKFLDILQETSDDYCFQVYSFCLMSNHYHLLLKTTKENLSRAMQKIHSRYSIYYNKKYKRVGVLWQGRFKSWYVFDETYLEVLVRYIEFNPIKAKITSTIGQYDWAMSSHHQKYKMLCDDLIKNTNLENEPNKKDMRDIDKMYNTKFNLQNDNIVIQKSKPLRSHFAGKYKEEGALSAIKDGYLGKDVALYLKLSKPAISKIIKIYKQKVKLFEKLRDKGVFWSYSKEMSYEEAGENLIIEYILKYGDFDDMKLSISLYGKRVSKKIWEERLKNDKSFIKTNLMIARVFFGMDVESEYFKGGENERLKKLKLLASY